MTDDRIPTALWVEGHLRRLNAEGVPYYITQKGAYAGGLVLLKINTLTDGCLLLTQQRDFETNKLGWANALEQEQVAESDADAYIRRATQRDPDLWVIEVEDREGRNPFLEQDIF